MLKGSLHYAFHRWNLARRLVTPLQLTIHTSCMQFAASASKLCDSDINVTTKSAKAGAGSFNRSVNPVISPSRHDEQNSRNTVRKDSRRFDPAADHGVQLGKTGPVLSV